jgi:sugar phosphate isomerase/epimerase
MIFVSTSCLKGRTGRFEKDFNHVLSIYDKLGVRNVELGAAHGPVNDFSPIFAYKRKHDARFILHANFPPIKEDMMHNIASSDEKIRQMSVNNGKEAIELCRKLESNLFSFNFGLMGDYTTRMEKIHDSPGYEVAYAIAKESLLTLLDYASQYNVGLALENHHKKDPILLVSADEYERLFKEVHHHLLGALVDLGHLRLNALNYGFDEKDFIRRLQDKIVELHIHEVRDGVDHKMLTGPSSFDWLPKDILKNACLTLEANQLSTEEIVKGVEIIQANTLPSNKFDNIEE